jgi:cell wall-associated NlpC family hydrolase
LHKPGDLLFFASLDGTIPKHMGIVLDSDNYIHNPRIQPKIDNTRMVKVSPIRVRALVNKNNPDKQIYLTNPCAVKIPAIHEGRWRRILT